ncbi:hypothetical protein KFL_012650010 [Klebsormidium nitens]|uniref:Uncharacterized protein n=1 Tax=Klebsormidium nitens TaxID=105231 RepID=A0A1Y1IWC9_KLENI|nr:hypothetical protein KFL_012650010 [Klebsormidium nitens]|eukprot:GAQ93037.1 hypothetical protein KFL_012650010 [Klebsormidium nitens]
MNSPVSCGPRANRSALFDNRPDNVVGGGVGDEEAEARGRGSPSAHNATGRADLHKNDEGEKSALPDEEMVDAPDAVVVAFPNVASKTQQPLVSAVNAEGYSIISKGELVMHFLPEGWVGTVVLKPTSTDEPVRLSPSMDLDGEYTWSLQAGEYLMEAQEKRAAFQGQMSGGVRASISSGGLGVRSSVSCGGGRAVRSAMSFGGRGRDGRTTLSRFHSAATSFGPTVTPRQTGMPPRSASLGGGGEWRGCKEGGEEAMGGDGRVEREAEPRKRAVDKEALKEMKEAWKGVEGESSKGEGEEKHNSGEKSVSRSGGTGSVVDAVLLSPKVKQTSRLWQLLQSVEPERVEGLHGPVDGDKVLLMAEEAYTSRGGGDASYWIAGKTTSMATLFGAKVRSWKCAGGKKCVNEECTYKAQFGEQNVKSFERRQGNEEKWYCFHCKKEAEDLGEKCEVLKWTTKNDGELAYCHKGKHNHDLAMLESKGEKDAYQMQVMEMVRADRSMTPARVKMAMAVEAILDEMEAGKERSAEDSQA